MPPLRTCFLPTVVIAMLGLGRVVTAAPGDYFAIRAVDQDTGRGVPLVALKTTNEVKYYTDSNGFVAFLEPGLMGQEVFFQVKSHGYEYPKDGFGYRGVRLKAIAGGKATVKVKRVNVAERLYRITGQGVYRDSILLGAPGRPVRGVQGSRQLARPRPGRVQRRDGHVRPVD